MCGVSQTGSCVGHDGGDNSIQSTHPSPISLSGLSVDELAFLSLGRARLGVFSHEFGLGVSRVLGVGGSTHECLGGKFQAQTRHAGMDFNHAAHGPDKA